MNIEVWTMDARWIAAFACGAAVALGGCSGNNAAAPAAPMELRTAQDGGGDPGDVLTEAQRTFDTAFERLQAELGAARRQFTRAADVASVADTDAARAGAQAAIDAARTALAAAVAGIKALEPPADDDGRLGRAHVLAGEADSALAVGNAALRAAEAALTASGAWSSRPVVPVDIERRAVTTTSLKRILYWNNIPQLLYEDGKVLLAEGRASSGDWLQAPGFPIMGATNTGYLRYDRIDHLYQEWNGGFSNSNARQPIVSGVRLDGDGLQIRWGGTYSGNNRPRSEVFGPDGTNDHDVTVDFGRPESATLPEGDAGYYWQKPIGSAGTYYVRLSNLYGVDRGTEYADGRPYPDDDENLYLSYMAYGFWDFIAKNEAPWHWDRVFPFHTGYFAFLNQNGKRAADISDENKLVSATFKGRTLAAQFNVSRRIDQYNHIVNLENNLHLRLRGDVELTATITSAAQTVSGKIMNMEQWDEANGHWEDWSRMLVSGSIPQGTTRPRLEAIDIDSVSVRADGFFEGGLSNEPDGFQDGAFRGRFYGAHDKMEAGGTWVLQGWPDNQAPSVLGSWGAKLVPDPDD